MESKVLRVTPRGQELPTFKVQESLNTNCIMKTLKVFVGPGKITKTNRKKLFCI